MTEQANTPAWQQSDEWRAHLAGCFGDVAVMDQLTRFGA